MSVKLITVDPVTMVRLGYSAACATYTDIDLVGQAATGEETRDLIGDLDPHVVTIDAAVPGEGGLQLAAELRAARPRLGLILTGPAEDGLLLQALQAGLSAYLPRSAPVELLMSAVRHAAVAPASFTAPNLAEAMARRRTRSTALSPREEQILQQLNTGGSLAAIAVRMRLTESTVRTYVARLYDKLGVHNRTQALQAAARLYLI
ncbi:DNA-binding response regulator [Catellatospora citrea]|uniref:DNA-binding response regulator n=1 Tax=Catellatospora citrea TaxID=53366 RepID=A0A8J3P2E8_9ACTN|nr:DNA-binding NarL/FixJ family response regulator [Catellatospora citrea]GIG01187.1 DNA-binding response regulator [Catellatospora citrea]